VLYWISLCFQFREKVYEIYEEICGARLTTNIWEELVVSKEIGHQKLLES
jgi:NADH:ubiquinone oxidoreductase subunit D